MNQDLSATSYGRLQQTVYLIIVILHFVFIINISAVHCKAVSSRVKNYYLCIFTFVLFEKNKHEFNVTILNDLTGKPEVRLKNNDDRILDSKHTPVQDLIL